jgi:hypothetical protein
MKATFTVIVVSIGLLLNSLAADVFSFDKDDPFIVISSKRAKEIVLSVKKREPVELLFGKGVKRENGKIEYAIRTPPELRPSGFAGSIVVEYDGNDQVVNCEVLVQSVVGANLEYPSD